MPTLPVGRLAEVFVEVADTLIDEFDLVEFLQMVTTRTAELSSAEAAGLLLADHQGRLQFMAASNEATTILELFQVQNQEGPCLDAFLSRSPVVNADLSQAVGRWPLFAPRAVEVGYRSVHAIPLRHRSEVIGALNLFSSQVRVLEPSDVKIMQALADLATIGLLQERAIRHGEVLSEQLQTALNSRIVIEQAKGALSEIHGVSVDDAFDLLRGYARQHGRRLGDVARAVVMDRASIPGLTSG